MKVFLLTLCLLGGFLISPAQEIQSYSFEELEKKITDESSHQYLVVNFWATWCAPCLQELPYFESLSQDFPNAKLKVLLVSLDLEKDKAIQFKEKKQLQSEVVYLNEVDFNAWINKISPKWSGAIPATLMLSPAGEKKFHEGEYTEAELYGQIKRFIQ